MISIRGLQRLTFVYLASYLLIGGGSLIVAPGLTLRLLMSNGDYGDVMPRLFGLFMFILGAAEWFAVVAWLAASNIFITGPSQLPIAVTVAFTTQILVFLVAVRTLPGLRACVTSLSPILLKLSGRASEDPQHS